MTTNSWKCGGCNTWYAPSVTKCECSKITFSGNVFTQGLATPVVCRLSGQNCGNCSCGDAGCSQMKVVNK